MRFVLKPWQLWVVTLAGWINQQQEQVIEFLRTENRVLRETHGNKRIVLNDDQRRCGSPPSFGRFRLALTRGTAVV